MKSLGFFAAALGALAVFCGTSNQSLAGTKSIGLYGSERQSEAGEIPVEYDSVIVRYFAGSKSGGKVVEDIRKMATAGRRVVVEFQFIRTPEQRRGKVELPPIDKTADELRDLLEQLDGVKLGGIVLGEENQFQPKQMAYLGELYKRTKETFPKRLLLQWLSIGSKQIHGKWDMKQFPADGYFVDPYLLSIDDYRELIEQLSNRGKPIYSVVWASPGWEVGGGNRKVAPSDWWNTLQWRIFYNRLAVNRYFGVETIFFTFALNHGKSTPLALGDSCDRKFSQDLRTKTIPYIKEFSISMEVPHKRPNWIPRYC